MGRNYLNDSSEEGEEEPYAALGLLESPLVVAPIWQPRARTGVGEGGRRVGVGV